MNRLVPTTTLAAALALLLGACSPAASGPAQEPPLAGAKIGGEFSLIDAKSQPVRYSDFAGKYRIVYFGYTYCPDVCPVDLQKLMQGLKLVERDQPELASQIQPIFITIDPARDTPAVVGEYTSAFSPRLIGLTGTEEQTDQAAKAFAVYRAPRDGGTKDAYLMDHSRIAFLMDRDGKPMAMLPVEKSPQEIAEEIRRWTA